MIDKYPLKHLSVRVPWHDNKWDGRVCGNPDQNIACLVLPRIYEEKNEEIEEKYANKKVNELNEEIISYCIKERATFMADFSFTKKIEHPYAKTSPNTHGHFAPTPLRFMPYSAPCLPFLWMNRKNSIEKSEFYELDFDEQREPDLGFSTNWIQEVNNQKALLDSFFGHIKKEQSLCFFYSKQVPFYEGSGRIIIGVGVVKNIYDGVEYNYSSGGALRSMLWERMVGHSIRPDYKDGFLLPYHQAIEYADANPDFDPKELIVLAPPDKKIEFSYASEHVSNDSATRVLLECKKSLEKAKELKFSGNFDEQIEWIDRKLNEIEKIRGFYPGLGSALFAFGIKLGYFIATEVIDKIKEDENPWDKIDEMFDNPKSILSESLADKITQQLQKSWQLLKTKDYEDRKNLLYLLSRLEINHEQAKILYNTDERNIKFTPKVKDIDLLNNPYLISEISKVSENQISLWTIDLAMFPKGKITKSLLPLNFGIFDEFDSRRIISFCIFLLEQAATNDGHTLLPKNNLNNKIRNLPVLPACNPTPEILDLAQSEFQNYLCKIKMKDDSTAFQLSNLYEMESFIRETIKRRVDSKKLDLNVDWEKLIKQKFPEDLQQADKSALNESISALKELSQSRFCILSGSAGTGKTSILSILCSINEIKNGGVLLLAPTGKARVKLQSAMGDAGANAYTIAQFLTTYKRYDFKTQTYNMSDEKGCSAYETVIIDEASMMTTEMLASVLDCIKTARRIIIVGDQKQLPPIGSGRPFADIVAYLAPENSGTVFPNISNCFVELMVAKRFKGKERLDLNLANWFRGSYLYPGEDSVWDEVFEKENKNIRFVEYDSDDEFKDILENVLAEELKLVDKYDSKTFNESIGAKASNGRLYFNIGSANFADDWQILSPIRGKVSGVSKINKVIHEKFKKDTIEYARKNGNKIFIPKPLGPEEIVYGDKIINL